MRTAPIIYRLLLGTSVFAPGFYAYAIVRGLVPDIGFTVSTFITCVAFTQFAVGALGWWLLLLVGIALFAVVSLIYRDIRPHSRWKRGRCLACNYPSSSANTVCPECGVERRPPPDRSTRLAFLDILAPIFIGLVLGPCVSELWVLEDEMRFKAEVSERIESGNTGLYSRSRRWPNRNSALIYSPEHGFWATC